MVLALEFERSRGDCGFEMEVADEVLGNESSGDLEG